MAQEIKDLTPEQEAQLEPYRDKWCRIGVSTDPIDLEKARTAIEALYKALDLSVPEAVLFDEPKKCLRFIDDETKRAGGNVNENRSGWVGGGMWAGTYAWYDFVSNVLKVDDEKKLAELSAAVAEEVSIWWPFDTYAVLCERPCTIKYADLKGDGQEVSHCDGGPAIQWPGGEEIHCLHGITVPRWLAEEDAEKIDAAKITELDNVEVRREFIRKVGVERVYQSLGGKTLDEASYTNDTGTHKYKLVSLQTYGPTQEPRPYLHMENPSLDGIFHLERVPLETRTVRAALLFRNHLTEAQIDDENGADWYQQGDVVLRDRHAKKFKFFPKALT